MLIFPDRDRISRMSPTCTSSALELVLFVNFSSSARDGLKKDKQENKREKGLAS